MALTVVTFLTCALIVVLAGIMLARNADVIAARTRLGGLWVGSVFLAIATSLPELTTDLSAVRLGAPDLAAGDLFGSSMANMLILALISLVPQGKLLFRKAALDHALYASLAIIMTCLAAIFIRFRLSVSFYGMGFGSILLVITYIVGSRAIFRHTSLARQAGRVTEMSTAEAGPQTLEPEARSPLRPAVFGFVAASVVTLIVAPVFARMAARLAEATGLGETFFGTWFVGIATPCPSWSLASRPPACRRSTWRWATSSAAMPSTWRCSSRSIWRIRTDRFSPW